DAVQACRGARRLGCRSRAGVGAASGGSAARQRAAAALARAERRHGDAARRIVGAGHAGAVDVGAAARRALRRASAPRRHARADSRRLGRADARVRRGQLRHPAGRIGGRAHRSPACVRVRGKAGGALHDGRGGMARRARGMTNLLLWAPLVLVVGGSVMYHLAAKSIPAAYDPMAALIGLYATALAGAAVAYAVSRVWRTPTGPLRVWHPTIAMVGVGALLIEMGFLL